MGKINPIVGVYIPIIRIPIKGGMTIPNIATFDHGTHSLLRGSSNLGSVVYNHGDRCRPRFLENVSLMAYKWG